MKTKLLLVSSLFFGVLTTAWSQNEIPSVGNVGIGTTQPTQKLDVRGSARIDSTIVIGDSIIVNKNAKVGQNLKVAGDAFIAGKLKVQGKTTLDKTVINDNLKINNLPVATIPGDVLTVNPDGTVNKIDVLAIGLLPYKPVTLPCNPTNANPTWSNGPNKIYVKCPDVKVGIGTENPTHHLTVTGISRFDDHAWFGSTISLGTEQPGFGKLDIVNTDNGAAIHVNNTGNANTYSKLLYFEYDNTSTEILKVHNTSLNYDPFLLNSNGGMTINNGTTKIFELGSDGQLILRNATGKTFQFDNNGMFRARRVRVDTESWADYVFEPDYKLLPLAEVKSFIIEEKHLPNIPSEKQLVAEGIDLAEMNKLLMQKIEELMLYLIDQNENTQELKQQVQELQLQISELQNASK